jgi:cold shock CspA family protein
MRGTIKWRIQSRRYCFVAQEDGADIFVPRLEHEALPALQEG